MKNMHVDSLKPMVINANYDPNLATKKLSNIRESMYSSRLKTQNVTTHLYRFDGLMHDIQKVENPKTHVLEDVDKGFIVHPKINEWHGLNSSYLTHTIYGSPIEYGNIYNYYKDRRKIFTSEEILLHPNIFRYVLLFFIDGKLYSGIYYNKERTIHEYVQGVYFLFTEETITIAIQPSQYITEDSSWSLLLIPSITSYGTIKAPYGLFTESTNSLNISSFIKYSTSKSGNSNEYIMAIGNPNDYSMSIINGCTLNTTTLTLPDNWVKDNPSVVQEKSFVKFFIFNARCLYTTYKQYISEGDCLNLVIDRPIPLNSILVWKEVENPSSEVLLTMGETEDYTITFKYPNLYCINILDNDGSTYRVELFYGELDNKSDESARDFYNEFEDFIKSEPYTYVSNLHSGDVPESLKNYEVRSLDDFIDNYYKNGTFDESSYITNDIFKMFLINEYGIHNPNEVLDYFESSYDLFYGSQYHRWFIETANTVIQNRSIMDTSGHVIDTSDTIFFDEPMSFLIVKNPRSKELSSRIWIDGIHFIGLPTYTEKQTIYIYFPKKYIKEDTVIELELIEASDQISRSITFTDENRSGRLGEKRDGEVKVARSADLLFIKNTEDGKEILFNQPYSSSKTHIEVLVRQFHSLMEYYKDNFYKSNTSINSPETSITSSKFNDEGMRHLREYMRNSVHDNEIDDYWDSHLSNFPYSHSGNDDERDNYLGDEFMAYNFSIRPQSISKFLIRNNNEDDNFEMTILNIANLDYVNLKIDGLEDDPYTHEELNQYPFTNLDLHKFTHNMISSADIRDYSDSCHMEFTINDPDSDDKPIAVSTYPDHYAFFIGGRRIFNENTSNRYFIKTPVNSEDKCSQYGRKVFFKASPILSLMNNDQMSIVHLPYAEKVVCHISSIPNVFRPMITPRRIYNIRSLYNHNIIKGVSTKPYKFPPINDHFALYDQKGRKLRFYLSVEKGMADFTHEELHAYTHIGLKDGFMVHGHGSGASEDNGMANELHRYFNDYEMTHEQIRNEKYIHGYVNRLSIDEFSLKKVWDENLGHYYYVILGYNKNLPRPVYLYHDDTIWKEGDPAEKFFACSYSERETSRFFFEDIEPSGKNEDGTVDDPLIKNKTTGLIDFRNLPGYSTCPLTRPFSLKYYDVYLNGRKLNHTQVKVLSETVIQIVNVKSNGSMYVVEKFMNYTEDQNIFDIVSTASTKNYLTSYNEKLLRSSEEYFNFKVENYFISPFELEADLYTNSAKNVRNTSNLVLDVIEDNTTNETVALYNSIDNDDYGLSIKDGESVDTIRKWKSHDFDDLIYKTYEDEEESSKDKDLPENAIRVIKEGWRT